MPGEQGYIVATAADAHTALDMVRGHTADLVVLDLGLPDMDGLDVVRQIESGKNSGVLCGSEQRRGWLKDGVEGRCRQVGLLS